MILMSLIYSFSNSLMLCFFVSFISSLLSTLINEKVHNELINLLKSSDIYAIEFRKCFWSSEASTFSSVLCSKSEMSVSFIVIISCHKLVWEYLHVSVYSLTAEFSFLKYFSKNCMSFCSVEQWLKWYIRSHMILNIISHAQQFHFMLEADFDEVDCSERDNKKYWLMYLTNCIALSLFLISISVDTSMLNYEMSE